MADILVKLGEMGTSTVLALCFLVALTMGGYFLFQIFPKFHGQAMSALSDLATAIITNVEEQRADRKAAESRHDEILVKLEELRRDFLSVDDTGEHKPVVIDKRVQPQHREDIA